MIAEKLRIAKLDNRALYSFNIFNASTTRDFQTLTPCFNEPIGEETLLCFIRII